MKARPHPILSLPSLLSLLCLLPLLSCRREPPPQELDAASPTRRARIFLIPLEEGATVPGDTAGCGGEIAAVEAELPVATPALAGSLGSLLDAGDAYKTAGYYNSLAHSPLRLERIERSAGVASIYLSGYLELGGRCDGPRALSQLTETAVQFRDVDRAQFFLDGQPLRELLASPHPPAPSSDPSLPPPPGEGE
jgi:hypothetical protein